MDKQQRIQIIKDTFSPETTDDEVILFILTNPFGVNIGAIMLESYMGFRKIFQMSPYEALLEEMNCLFQAMEDFDDKAKSN